MPKKKKTEDISSQTEYDAQKIKTKTLFDHINAVTQFQDDKYFNKLTDADKRTWSNYMINRFMSMNPDWVEIIAELDQYTVGNQLPSELMYKLYINIFPKGKIYFKYIKSSNDIKYNSELVNIIKKYYEISKKQAVDYLNIYYSTNEGIEKLKQLIAKYGIEQKEINKLIKI